MATLCPACNAPIHQNAKFCTNCGALVQETTNDDAPTTCPNCQADLPANVKFCPNCGQPVGKELHPVAIQAFLDAILDNEVLTVEKMVRADRRYIRVRDSTVNHDTPMHYAARLGQEAEKMMLVLILHGAEVDRANDRARSTPLHYCTTFTIGGGIDDAYPNTRSMSVLLEHGANPNAQNAEGETPLHLVKLGGASPISTLCYWGADPTIQNNEGLSPLQIEENIAAELEAHDRKREEELEEEYKGYGYSGEKLVQVLSEVKAQNMEVQMKIEAEYPETKMRDQLRQQRLEALRKCAAKRKGR